jgi:hypothetical protein
VERFFAETFGFGQCEVIVGYLILSMSLLPLTNMWLLVDSWSIQCKLPRAMTPVSKASNVQIYRLHCICRMNDRNSKKPYDQHITNKLDAAEDERKRFQISL